MGVVSLYFSPLMPALHSMKSNGSETVDWASHLDFSSVMACACTSCDAVAVVRFAKG